MSKGLPRSKHPLFDEVIPSTEQKIFFRPFLCKEEKILLMSQQSGAEKDIITGIKQVIINCVQEKIDIDRLATFDLEYLFLKLRAKSVNNIVEVSYRDLEDDKVYDLTVDLDDVKLIKNPDIDKKIKIDDNIGIIMRYPSVSMLDNMPETDNPSNHLDYLISNCIECVYDSAEVYPIAEQTAQEVQEFIDELDLDTFEKIKKFFNDLPKLYYKITYTNSLGNERHIELTSLRDFFTWG